MYIYFHNPNFHDFPISPHLRSKHTSTTMADALITPAAHTACNFITSSLEYWIKIARYLVFR